MKLANNLRLMRIPSPKGDKEGTGILDKNNKLVAYSPHIISLKENKPNWAWTRYDFGEINK